MYNDADIEMLELEDASRWMYCSDCGDEVRRRGDETRCKRCISRGETIAQEMREYMAFGIEGAPDYADEHECGQLRIAVPGEQVSLLPLPDRLIPSEFGPVQVVGPSETPGHVTVRMVNPFSDAGTVVELPMRVDLLR